MSAVSNEATISRERSQEEVGQKRQVGFYAASGLFLLISLGFFGLMANILTPVYTGSSSPQPN